MGTDRQSGLTLAWWRSAFTRLGWPEAEPLSQKCAPPSRLRGQLTFTCVHGCIPQHRQRPFPFLSFGFVAWIGHYSQTVFIAWFLLQVSPRVFTRHWLSICKQRNLSWLREKRLALSMLVLLGSREGNRPCIAIHVLSLFRR